MAKKQNTPKTAKRLNYQSVNQAVIKNFACSKFYLNKFLNLISGEYMATDKVIEIITFNLASNDYVINEAKIIIWTKNALRKLGEVDKAQCAKIKKTNGKWKTLEGKFDKKSKVLKENGIRLRSEFVKLHGNMSNDEFYNYVRAWCAENGYTLNFVRSGGFRRVVVTK